VKRYSLSLSGNTNQNQMRQHLDIAKKIRDNKLGGRHGEIGTLAYYW
jgi:hypothetical protein